MLLRVSFVLLALLPLSCIAQPTDSLTLQRIALPSPVPWVAIEPWVDSHGALIQVALQPQPLTSAGLFHTPLYIDTFHRARYELEVPVPRGEVAVWWRGTLIGTGRPGSPVRVPLSVLAPLPGWYTLHLEYSRATVLPRAFLVLPGVATPVASDPDIAEVSPRAWQPQRVEILLLLLLPAVVLVFWRLTDTVTFDRLLTFRRTHTQLYETAEQGNLLRGVSLVWALLLRLVITAGVLLGIYLLPVYGGGNQVLGLRQNLSAFMATYPDATVWSYLAGFLLLAVAIMGVRYGVLMLVGWAYSYRVFVRWVNGLDTLASLPGLLVVYLVLWSAIFTADRFGGFLLGLSGGLVLAYVVWHALILLRGVVRRRIFSPVGLALYICTLEALPWLLIVVLVPNVARG